jgi:hypothetical protein
MNKRAAGVGLAMLSGSALGAAGGWEPLPPLPAPNAAFACARVPGAILVLGGTNWEGGKKNWLTAVHAFDLATQQWRTLAPLAQPLAYPVVGENSRGLVAAGGTTGEAPFAGAVQVDAALAVVESKTGLATPSVYSAGGQIGDRLILVGGTDSPSNVAGLRRDAFAWDVRTGQEQALPPHPGSVHGVGASVVMGDDLLVFGGFRMDAATGKVVNLAEAHAFSVRRNEWRALQPMPRGVRALTAVRLDDRHIYLAGGARDEPEGFTDAAFVYDLVENRYRAAPPLPYRAALVGLILDGDYVYCIAGEDKGQHRTDAVYRIKRAALLVEAGR